MREKGRRQSAGIWKTREELCILSNRTENFVEVKNDVLKNTSPEKKKRQAIVIHYQIPIHAFLLSSLWRMQVIIIPQYIVSSLSFRTLLAPEISEVSATGTAIKSSPKVLAKRNTWVGPRCKWQVRMTEPDPFGQLNEIIFPERNHSEGKRRYNHAAWYVTEFTAHNYHIDRIFAQFLLCRNWK